MNDLPTDLPTGTTDWIKASYSDNGSGCVSMRRHDGKIQVRDSKLGDNSPVLNFSKSEIVAWLDGANKKEFDTLFTD